MAIEIKYKLGNHKDKEVIFIHFEKNQEMNQRVRKLVGVKWSNSKKSWYVLDSAFYREKFKIPSKSLIGKEVLLYKISDLGRLFSVKKPYAVTSADFLNGRKSTINSCAHWPL
ncbi:MAG: hypothetical protein KA313_09740 [Pseudarcicella sp.]|nr:hypothetical protein [Pseudarcicella sp.]